MGAMKDLAIDIQNERAEEWADALNERFGIDATVEEVLMECADDCMGEFSLMAELMDDSFTDTSPMEKMANAICNTRIGMDMPCYGDPQDYKDKFHSEMNNWVLDNMEEV